MVNKVMPGLPQPDQLTFGTDNLPRQSPAYSVVISHGSVQLCYNTRQTM